MLSGRVLRGQAKLFVLPFPFSRQIAQGRDPETTWQPSIDCGLCKRRCEKGKRDIPVDLPDTAFLTIGDLFNVCDCSFD